MYSFLVGMGLPRVTGVCFSYLWYVVLLKHTLCVSEHKKLNGPHVCQARIYSAECVENRGSLRDVCEMS